MTQFTTATFSDLIENVYRRALGGVTERTVLGTAVTNSATSVTLSGPQLTSVVPGTRLSVDLEVCYVTAIASGVATITRGWSGSTPAAHAANAIWYVNPRFTRFDIGVAINDEIRSLSSPTNGLYRVGNASLTYNPVYVGYDMGAVSPEFIKVIQARFKVPTPYRFYPRIKQNDFEVDRNQPDTAVFPSGMAFYVKRGGFPGLPIYLTYTAPFIPLVNLTDDIHNTPSANDPAPPYNGYGSVTTVSNLSNTMDDLIPLGAIVRIVMGREIARNFIEAQPDARIALEVPQGAVMASVNGLMMERQARIQEEADRLARKYALPRRY